MIDPETAAAVVAMIGPVVTGLVTWGAMRSELRFLWKTTERQERRQDDVERRLSIVERMKS